MSESSGSSTGTTRGPWGRGKVVGIPEKCWSGERIVALISRSEPNPYRRYYRCDYAARLKLCNDEHSFKWVEEATIDEVQRLESRIQGLENELKAMKCLMGTDEDECEKMRMSIATDISQKIEERFSEGKSSFLKIIGCLVILVVVGVIVKANKV